MNNLLKKGGCFLFRLNNSEVKSNRRAIKNYREKSETQNGGLNEKENIKRKKALRLLEQWMKELENKTST